MTEKEEKIDTIAKIVLSIILVIVDTIGILFFYGIARVNAQTTSEIPYTQLTTPIEVKYGYYDSGTLRTSDMTANYTDFNYEGIERFTYYTGQTNSDSKVLTLWLQNALAENSYYSITIYYKFTGSQSQIWYDYYRPCVGTYAQCGMNTENMADYRSQVLLASNINNPVYITRPTTGTATYDNQMWTRFAVYTQQYIIKTNSTGPFITLFFDQTNTGTFAFYGYTIESVGNNPVSVLNAISTQTNTINSYTQQQNQATQNTIESSTQQQTQDLYGQDLDNADKQQADNTGVNNYNTTESQLNNLMDTNAIDNVSLAIDFNSNNWIWNTITSLLNTNTIVYTLVISILAIGVIKLALAR